MKLLTAVNLVLPKLGERPVTALNVKHPTLSILLPVIEQKRREHLTRGWWFNEYKYTANPAVDGTITMGADTLRFVPDCPGVATLRGLALFNPNTLSFVFDGPVRGVVTQDIAFDDIPESVASYVFYASLVDAYATDIGVSQELAIWQENAGLAWSDALAEHLRQKKYNTRNSRAWRRYVGALRG